VGVLADTGYTVAVFASRRGWDFAPGLGSFDPLLPAIPVYSGPSGILGPTNLIDATPLRLQLPKELIHAHSYGNDRTTSLRGDGTVRHDFLASYAPCIRFGHLHPLSDGRLSSERAPSPQHSLPRRLDCLSLLTCSWGRPFTLGRRYLREIKLAEIDRFRDRRPPDKADRGRTASGSPRRLHLSCRSRFSLPPAGCPRVFATWLFAVRRKDRNSRPGREPAGSAAGRKCNDPERNGNHREHGSATGFPNQSSNGLS